MEGPRPMVADIQGHLGEGGDPDAAVGRDDFPQARRRGLAR